jgi:hypothetical protein
MPAGLIMAKYGQFADAHKAASAMPAFKDVLDDQEILAALTYLKASWPIGLRVLQAMGNPGRAGMPREADRGDWKFPPNCWPRALRVNQTRDRT